MNHLKLVKTDDLVGGEIVACSVMTNGYQLLLSEGTIIRKEYIQKLQELHINEVYIKEENSLTAEEIVILKENMEKVFKDKVKGILEKHIYHHNQELVELCNTADYIINNILDDEKVIEHVYDIKERSADIYEHSISICSMSILVALKMQLNHKQTHDIGVGALLHDIGLRYLTVNYKDQDVKELTEMEYVEYKKHPVYGYTALKEDTWLSSQSKNIILYHHESLDGSGFPLRATKIPLEAKIVSICDVFDEMICGIGCKRCKVYEAIEYLKNFKDYKYDGIIVKVFLSFVAVYPVGSKVRLVSGEKAIVVKQNGEFPDRPIIKIIEDEGNKISRTGSIINLMKDKTVFITEVLN